MVRPVLNLRNVDLNLLVALDALLAERSVSGAGRRIGLSQSAMSAALARLRIVFRDPLLVRSGRNLVLTQRAEELIIPVREILSRVEQTISEGPQFDPLTASRSLLNQRVRLCNARAACTLRAQAFGRSTQCYNSYPAEIQRRRPSAEDRPGRHGYRAA
jgi:DNA-binding transcriptional LysR family regulator